MAHQKQTSTINHQVLRGNWKLMFQDLTPFISTKCKFVISVTFKLSRAYDRLTKKRKSITNYWATKIAVWSLRLIVVCRKVTTAVSFFTLCILGLIIASGLLFFDSPRAVIDNFKPFEAILVPLGAAYGTILALVLTLSIIPIQRAGEAWSPSIIRLYRRDRATHISFIIISVFCIACFAFAVRGIAYIPASIIFACALVSLGITLDLLRWYHSHVCQMLDPAYAVQFISLRARRMIDKMQSNVKRIAKLQHKMLDSKRQKNASVEQIETMVYQDSPHYKDSINYWINDLGEIAVKAISRGERLLARSTIFTITELTNHYLSVRKQNLVIVPSPIAMFLASESDVDVITGRAYEILYEISKIAISQNDESTAIGVSEGYQSIAVHTANLSARAFRPHTAPLTYSPIYYMLSSVKYAQTKGLDEMPYQTSAMLSKISIGTPKDIAHTDVHIPLIDGLHAISMYYYGKHHFALAEETIGNLFLILAHMLQNKDRHFPDILRYVLEKIEQLAPLAIINEALSDQTTCVKPLGKAYGLVNPSSLGHLFDQASNTLPYVDADHEHVNPYHSIISMADTISRHLRNVAERSEFGNSFLIWDVDGCIKHMARVIIQIVDKPLRPDHGDEMDLVKKFEWVLAFYWVAFTKKKSISKRRADEVCDSLVFIGLLYLSRNWYIEVLRLCIEHIRSILESYCEIDASPDYYAIGDLLAHLWVIRMVLVSRNNTALITLVDQALHNKPPALKDEQWQAAQRAILIRRDQKEKSVSDRDIAYDDGEAIAHQMLHETKAKKIQS